MAKRSFTPTGSRGKRRFDPVEFLETAAKGRIISAHKKKQIIFAQGDAADSVNRHAAVRCVLCLAKGNIGAAHQIQLIPSLGP